MSGAGYSLETSSSSSASGRLDSVFNNSGFTVDFGGDALGSKTPSVALIAIVVLVGWLVWKHAK